MAGSRAGIASGLRLGVDGRIGTCGRLVMGACSPARRARTSALASSWAALSWAATKARSRRSRRPVEVS